MQVATAHFKTTLAAQDQPNTISLHLEFVRRTQEGPALFTVRDVKIGRQTSTIHISLSQDGKEEVAGYITNMNMVKESGLNLETGWKLDPPSPAADLRKLELDEDENWGLQRSMPFAHFRRATSKVQFYFPKKGQISRNISDEWIKLSTGENWTNESLGFLSGNVAYAITMLLN